MTNEQFRKSVLQRLGTITDAVNKLSAHILENYTEACLDEANIDDFKGRHRIGELTER